jgi:hydroxymethylglutaryl-CoA lyase
MSVDKTGLLLEDETLRDGLQIESRLLTIEQKIKLCKLLVQAGIKRIQVGSFVHPKVVPQMADTDELIGLLGHRLNTVLSALVLNAKGLERALACGIEHVSMSVSVSNAHSLKNARKPAREAITSMVELIRDALKNGLQVRAGLQSAFGCVYEGSISVDTVLDSVEQVVSSGVSEINLADSTGMATPHSIKTVVEAVSQRFPEIALSLHLHDTRGLGLLNMYTGYLAGVRKFDVCAGGMGGCPFIRGAAGNVATEDAVNMFESLDIATGIDLGGLIKAVSYLEDIIGRSLPGRMKRVIDFQQAGISTA